jgi:uncharacterized protein DUF6578
MSGYKPVRHDRLVTTFVWVDAWQQQCCGEDFRVGSTVDWNAKPEPGGDEWVAELLGDEWGQKVSLHEEHHEDLGDDVRVRVSGIVRSIRIVSCDRVLGRVEGPGPDEAMVPVPGSGRLREVEVADRWGPEPHSGDLSTTFDGWIVELEVEAPVQ